MLASSALIKVTPGLMIWTLVCFAITFFVLRKYAFGPIQKVIDDRRERIRQSIEEADRAREEARHLLEEHRKLVGKAKTEADRQRRLEETKRQIEAETQRALEQIRAEVAELTLVATSKVTGKVLDRDDHRKLIEDAIGDLDFSVLEKERV